MYYFSDVLLILSPNHPVHANFSQIHGLLFFIFNVAQYICTQMSVYNPLSSPGFAHRCV